MRGHLGRVAVVWRGDREPTETRNYDRLRPVFDALTFAGIDSEPVVYNDQTLDAARDRLLRADGALVWVDPIGGGEDRAKLDAILRETSSRGIWVSAHPDTILKMGTKEVLYRTKSLGWGTDTHLYATISQFREQFPSRLRDGQPRVLKQNRGNGGIGVWKVTLLRGVPAIVRVQHAAPRNDVTEDVTLESFMNWCDRYFAGSAPLIDQAFVSRLAAGMIRAYLVQDEVVGFARQQPEVPSDDSDAPAADKVLGMPAAKTMYPAFEPTLAALKHTLEREWVPGLCQLVGIDDGELPLLWDADFLYGPPTGTGADTYILCEINVSSVLPFPDQVPSKLAHAVARRLTGRS